MSYRLHILLLVLVTAVFCYSGTLSAQDVNNDYFSPQRNEKLLSMVEQYHLRTESFWSAYRSARPGEALSDVEFVLRYFPNHPQALMLLGSIARLIKNTSLGVAYYEKALALYPQHALTHAQYGAYLVEINRTEAGIAELKRAIQLDPNLVSAHVWLAQAYFKSGDKKLARRTFEKAKELGYKGRIP